MTVGIRELKNNLSHYVRKAEAGERVEVTAHGRIVAELVPAGTGRGAVAGSRFERLVASGVVVLAREKGDPTDGWPAIRMAPGSVQRLIDEDRGEA
jgi:prevent-host-death family protein